jgi:outer membrane protein OmpA-like peptidoglycan-associated protein/tetratricopeptide (TPR) repeat protein
MKKLYILSLLFCVTLVFAQPKLKKADQLFKTFAYAEAAKTYEDYLQNVEKPSTQTVKNVADSYYFIDDNRNALKWYQKLYEIQGQNMTDVYFLRYIQSMKGVTDYEMADKLTKEFLNKKGDQKEIQRFVSQKKQLDSLANSKPLYAVKNLDINSSKSDFGVAFYGEKVVFSSSRDTTKFNEKLYSWNNQPFLDLYLAERNMVDGSLFNESVFLKEVQTKYHEATAAFSSDLKTVYFTANILKKKSLAIDDTRTNNFQIIKGTIENEKLVKSEKLFFNSLKYSVGHPAISEDGRLLFFASDMPGGYGQTDLYVVQIAEDGTMGSPQNLGPTINTIGNEFFPFYRNGTLYFSSDGHYGLGDLDVYESKILDGLKFSEPRNLGSPINSNKDDFAYILDEKETYGYFSSNRALGKGSDDIYYFTKSKPECNQLVSGKVIDAKSKNAIDLAIVQVFDAFNDFIVETTTDSQGNYTVKVPCGKSIKIKVSKLNHSTEQKQLEITSIDGVETKDVNFELSKYEDLIVKENGVEKISINPIFFEYDKAVITKASEAELDKVVFVMEKFPLVKIKIESHTDSRGSDAYNMKLSDARAKATQAYIISKGIETSRIESAIGFGESRLKNKCSNGVKCSDEEHFVNRRSDFIIIEK